MPARYAAARARAPPADARQPSRCSETACSEEKASPQLGHATVSPPLASGRREEEEEMTAVKGVNSEGPAGRGGCCLGAGLGLGLGFEGREEEVEAEGGGPEPRTWEGPLKDGAEEEVTFFMRSFILSFIMEAGGDEV